MVVELPTELKRERLNDDALLDERFAPAQPVASCEGVIFYLSGCC